MFPPHDGNIHQRSYVLAAYDLPRVPGPRIGSLLVPLEMFLVSIGQLRPELIFWFQNVTRATCACCASAVVASEQRQNKSNIDLVFIRVRYESRVVKKS